MFVKALTACLAVLALAGCGGSSATSPRTSSTSPSPSPSGSSVVAMDRQAFCRAVINDNQVAVAAITKLVQHPDAAGLTVDDFQTPRNNLAEDAKHAPADLKGFLDTEVGVLDQVIAVFTTGQNTNIQTGDLRDASIQFLMQCGGETS